MNRKIISICFILLLAFCLSSCQESNEAKFDRAQQYLSEKNYDEAEKLLTELADKHYHEAIVLLQELYSQPFEMIKIPYLVGLEVKEAEQLLDSAGLKYKEMYVNSDTVDNNVVMYQNPDAEIYATPGDVVILSVSSGPST